MDLFFATWGPQLLSGNVFDETKSDALSENIGVSLSKLLVHDQALMLVCLFYHFLQALKQAFHTSRHSVTRIVVQPLDILIEGKARNPSGDFF